MPEIYHDQAFNTIEPSFPPLTEIDIDFSLVNGEISYVTAFIFRSVNEIVEQTHLPWREGTMRLNIQDQTLFHQGYYYLFRAYNVSNQRIGEVEGLLDSLLKTGQIYVVSS